MAGTAAATTYSYHIIKKADIYLYRARRYFDHGDYKSSIPLYQRAVSCRPDYPEAMRELAYAYHWSGDWKHSKEIFDRLVELYPHDKHIKRALAEAYSWDSRHDRAVEIYKELINEEPQEKDILKKLGEVYFWNKQYVLAVDILNRYLEDCPDDSYAKLLLAKSLHYGGRTGQAAVLYKEILRQNNKQAGS